MILSMYNPIKIQITPEMLERAKSRDCGQMNSKSFMKGKGNIVGFLGEEMVQSLSKDFIWKDSYDYDFSFKGRTVDVKSKYQSSPLPPKPNYEASIGKDSLHQRTEFYIFCRIYRDKDGNYPHGWILGAISKEEYFKKAHKLLKWQIDPSNNFYVREDCYNLPYSELHHIKSPTRT